MSEAHLLELQRAVLKEARRLEAQAQLPPA
jgi:hypothetical protein